MTTDDTDRERSENRTPGRRRGDRAAPPRRANESSNPGDATPNDDSVERYENGGRRGHENGRDDGPPREPGDGGSAWNAGPPNQQAGSAGSGVAGNRRYGSQPPSPPNLPESETTGARPPGGGARRSPSGNEQTAQRTGSTNAGRGATDAREPTSARRGERPNSRQGDPTTNEANERGPGDEPKRTQPMGGPSSSVEGAADEVQSPQRYGGPVDPSWQRTRNSRRERTTRRYEQQFDRQQERQRDVQRGKGSNSFRRGR